jgi:Holliday junction resolvase RusA-like endonuclease
MKVEQIKITYPGAEISVNHYLGRRAGGGYYKLQECSNWQEEFTWLLKRCHLEDFKLPLHVKCDGTFKDLRSAPDLSNLSKVILDTIQDLTNINDKNFRWQDGKRIIDNNVLPFLLITFSEPSNDLEMPAEGSNLRKVARKRKKGIGV